MAEAPALQAGPVGDPAYPSRRARREAEARAASPVPVPPVPPAPPAQEIVLRAPQALVRREPAAPVPVVPRRRLRQQLASAGTMVLVAGLFAALGIPAYAGGGEVAEAPLPIAQAVQGFEVSASAAESEIGLDTYGATSGLEMRAQYMSAVRDANLRAYLASGARELGDDYPWAAEPHQGQGGGLSPLNYFYRECVDFVAWRLNRDAGVTHGPWKWNWSSLTPTGGNAISWKYAWDAHGWDTSSKPRVGWVAWFGGANHVAYVSEVYDNGTILIEEYNGMGTHVYGQRVIDKDSVTLYLAPPG